MEIRSIFSRTFMPYGRVLQDLVWSELREALHSTVPQPGDGVAYVPSHPPLEALPVAAQLRDSLYGGMPIQVGYCSGTNTRLGCLEYHRDSEINLTEGDVVFLVAHRRDLEGGTLHTDKVEAFRAPAGTAVELYATTMHYAPCDGVWGGGFRVAVVLPRGTNLEKPAFPVRRAEDSLLWARNKWLIAHEGTPEAAAGAFVGLLGEDPDIAEELKKGGTWR